MSKDWTVEDRHSDYILFSKECGKLTVCMAVMPKEYKVEMYADIFINDVLHDTDRVSFDYNAALHVLGLSQDDIIEMIGPGEE
jgi:hypothetical protein